MEKRRFKNKSKHIEEIEKSSFDGLNKYDIAKNYQIKPSILCSIIKTKEKMMKAAESDTRLKIKHIKNRSMKAQISLFGPLFGFEGKECSMLLMKCLGICS